jgi:hypothetical protein
MQRSRTYDYNNDNFRFLAESGIEPVIKVRSNSSTKANGCKPRKLVVVVIEEQLAADVVKHWKKKHGYGVSWRMAESAFLYKANVW